MDRVFGSDRLKARMLAASDQQISLTDPDSRSMATSGRGSGVVGYNVQVAVDTEHHLIITHEVTNVGSDRAQLARMAKETKATLERTSLDAIADRGYFSSEEIPKETNRRPGHGLSMRGNSHLIICRYGSPLDGIRPIAFLAKGLALLFGLSLVLRKRHPFADDFAARLMFRLHVKILWSQR
jgi:Transposase DDE domain